jgi:Helicase HerA, central domain
LESPRVIGHIVSVQGFRVKVELLPEAKSAMRATLDGVQAAVAINSYLTFSIGAGQLVIGIITDLEARESYDPSSGDDLTLELMKPRRVATVQLLGTIETDDAAGTFSPGITVLPTLDTPAEVGSPGTLKAVFETPPRRNRPEGHVGEDFDCDLHLGWPTGQPANKVKASYNDLFSRPLAIVGNTGSGKSYTVSSLIQKAMALLADARQEPHIFILDINGEYGRAFQTGLDREKTIVLKKSCLKS